MKKADCACILFVLMFVTCTLPMQAQAQEEAAVIDSLKKALPALPDDTNKANILAKISTFYHTTDPALGIKYGKESYSLAKKLKWVKGVAQACNALGLNYMYRSTYDTALQYHLESLQKSEKIGDKTKASASMANIGAIYCIQGNYPKALEYMLGALKICELQGNKAGIANILGNIGNIFIDEGNYAKALEYYGRAMKMNEELDNKTDLAMNLTNMGSVYHELHDFEKALKYQMRALDIFEQTGDNYGKSISMGNIGNEYIELKNYSEALKWFTKAMQVSETIGAESAIAINAGNTGCMYLLMAKSNPTKKEQYLNHAVANFNKAIDISQRIGVLSYVKHFDSCLSEAYVQAENYKKALEAYQQYSLYKDSMFNKENTEKIARLEVKAEYEKTQLADSIQNAEARKLAAVKLQRQKTFTYSGIGVAMILSILAFSIAKERKKSDKLLLNILPTEVAAELKKKGEADAQLFDNVTVLFTDFVGFTKVAERLTPKQLVDELHMCFKSFDEIASRYGIEKIKTIGDAYLAVCGLPIADKKHAEKVVSAAKEILEFIQQRRAQLGDKTFDIRIGIHSGEVVAGIVGVKKFAYDIWGDTVNTAARMEQKSEPGRINISEKTHELVQDKFTFTYRGELEAKNKGKLKMYFVE